MNAPLTDAEAGAVTTDKVVEVALHSFATNGFDETRLEAIAQESGMSKRMIHYHFGDKKGLYLQTFYLAIAQLRPEPRALELESTVPVDGVRKVVEVIYRQFEQHPNAARLILMENLYSYAEIDAIKALTEQSNVLLQMDKLLMLGQDAGAFRPGISALDVYLLIVSLCMFRISNRDTFLMLYKADLQNAENTAGMLRLCTDATLSFLTSNMPNTGGMSYIHPHECSPGGCDNQPDVSGDIYGL
ncbi:MAG: TetR/AcrR family transcriptional regulator [Corynebacterium sp.]|nr:TetR/AcrR family transcriptional regulator [Corynebacterium sp.]